MSESHRYLLACLLIGIVASGLADELSLEEIVVVAQKRVAPLKDVPLSVAVLSGSEMVSAGVRDVFDVSRQIPSLDVFQNAGPINTSFRIRRIGNEANIPNFEPAVGLFVDGAFRTRSGVGVGDLFDVERIEVLRGPQTTLYGKNTTAGLISIITKKPTDSLEFSGEVTAGRVAGADSAGLTRVEAAVSGPIADDWSGRISGSFFDHGHTMTNLFVNDDSQDMARYSLRTQLLFAPSQQLEARLVVGRFVIDSASAGEFEIDEGIAIAALNSAFGVPCPPTTSTDRAFCNNRAVVVDLEANDITLDVSYNFGSHTLTSISAYEDYDTLRDFDADQLNIDLVDFADTQVSESYSQELRVASSPGEAVQWMAGLYYYHNDFQRGDGQQPSVVLGPAAPLVNLPPGLPYGQPGDTAFLFSISETEHTSAFAHTHWGVNDRFTLSFGGRWQREDKRSDIMHSTDHVRPTLLTLGLAPPGANAMLSRKTSDFTWHVDAKYQWSEEAMVYASVSRGFKSGGFNAGFGNTPVSSREFNDETVISYELGAKASLLGRRVQLNAALFSSEYDDFQSAGFVGLRFLVNNAERVDVSGFEMDLRALLNPRFRGGVDISYVDAKYGRYTGGACHFGRMADNADGSACVLTGATLPLAPRWKSSVNVTFQEPTAWGSWHARADWAWTDSYHTNASLDPRHVQGAYGLINLRGGLRFGSFDLTAWVKNLTDETYVMQDGPTNLFASDPAFARFLGTPRSYGVTLTARW